MSTSSKTIDNHAVVTEEDTVRVTNLLGRPPRGLIAISVRSKQGCPVVIQVASLVDNKPFPTLYWLVDKLLNYEIDRLEAAGCIAQFQAEVDQSMALQKALLADHRSHIRLRYALMTPKQSECLEKLGYLSLFQQRGIGGIERFHRIRCLHTFYAAHLVVPNTVGKMVDRYWRQSGIHFDHLI